MGRSLAHADVSKRSQGVATPTTPPRTPTLFTLPLVSAPRTCLALTDAYLLPTNPPAAPMNVRSLVAPRSTGIAHGGSERRATHFPTPQPTPYTTRTGPCPPKYARRHNGTCSQGPPPIPSPRGYARLPLFRMPS